MAWSPGRSASPPTSSLIDFCCAPRRGSTTASKLIRCRRRFLDRNPQDHRASEPYSQLLTDVESVSAEADDIVLVRFIPKRTRDAHLMVAGMPIFSKAYWSTRDFEASTLEPPLSSGPL